MNKKILGVLVMMLLMATTVLPVVGTLNETDIIQKATLLNNPEANGPPSSWLKGSDQIQTSHCEYGFIINPTYSVAQEFKPSKATLTAVALAFFAFTSPPSDTTITASIRETLDGNDLAMESISADSWKIGGETWVLFDFDDIEVIPEQSYYIVCTADKGFFDFYDANNTNVYCWLFDFNNQYDRGIAFQSNDSEVTWLDLEDPFDDPEYVECDFTFITYYQEPKSKIMTHPILRFLENHPVLNSMLKYLLSHMDLPQ